MNNTENKAVKEIYSLLKKHEIAPTALAINIKIVPTRLFEILKQKRRVTADTDLRLCKFFKKINGHFLKLQLKYDLETAETKIHETLNNISTIDEIPNIRKF